MNFLKFFFVLAALNAIIFPALSNNVQIANLTKSGSTISFELSWENSWYAGIEFHDAVWIFVKQAPNGGPSWTHANITSAIVGAGFTQIVPSDEMGLFVRRSINGNGTATTTVTAELVGLTGAFQDIKVMAVEMVYVPQASFYAGDGASLGRIASGADVLQPVHVTSNIASLTCGNTAGDIQYASGTCQTIPAGFPKGFGKFYCMKYGISQSQYVDFLNCLNRPQQENRVSSDITGSTVTNIYVLSNTLAPDKGNAVRCDANIGSGNVTFYCDNNQNGVGNEANDGMNRACNYLRVTDWAAYLDWAGLRPMTFLEVEKASRGPLSPVPDEYSWGSTLWTTPGTLENVGTATEKWTNSYIDGGISTFTKSVIRLGANAPGTGASREISNASYYGIIDIGNNPGDFFVGKSHVGTFLDESGDGVLSVSGDANVSSWPVFDASQLNPVKISSQSDGISTLNFTA